jgi:hypothetical protein
MAEKKKKRLPQAGRLFSFPASSFPDLPPTGSTNQSRRPPNDVFLTTS